MKARIKKTGEIVEVYHETQHGTPRMIYKESVLVNSRMWAEDELELLTNNEEDAHWQDVRERAAMAALQGILANPTIIDAADDHRLTAVKDAVGFADELVKQLKEHSNETN